MGERRVQQMRVGVGTAYRTCKLARVGKAVLPLPPEEEPAKEGLGDVSEEPPCVIVISYRDYIEDLEALRRRRAPGCVWPRPGDRRDMIQRIDPSNSE